MSLICLHYLPSISLINSEPLFIISLYQLQHLTLCHILLGECSEGENFIKVEVATCMDDVMNRENGTKERMQWYVHCAGKRKGDHPPNRTGQNAVITFSSF